MWAAPPPLQALPTALALGPVEGLWSTGLGGLPQVPLGAVTAVLSSSPWHPTACGQAPQLLRDRAPALLSPRPGTHPQPPGLGPRQVLSSRPMKQPVPAGWGSPQHGCCPGSALCPWPTSLFDPPSKKAQWCRWAGVGGHLQGTGQQPPEDLVTAIAEEAVGVDAVELAVEPQLDLVGWILSWAGCLEGDLCGGAPQVHGPQGPLPWPEPPACPAILQGVEAGVSPWVGAHTPGSLGWPAGPP